MQLKVWPFFTYQTAITSKFCLPHFNLVASQIGALQFSYQTLRWKWNTAFSKITKEHQVLLFNNESYFMVNWAEAYGGAVLLKASHGILINNTFFNNKAFDGGAVYANESLCLTCSVIIRQLMVVL